MYYHGSIQSLTINTILVAQKDGYAASESDLELLFEAHRPNGYISRKNAVYCTDNPELIDPAGGFTDFIYLIKVDETPTKHDLYWYSKADEYLQNSDIVKAKECAINYWKGLAADNLLYSCFEYLSNNAIIVEEFID